MTRTGVAAAAAAAVAVALLHLPGAQAIDNGLGLTPPLGWRSYNAYGGTPTQAVMESTMDAMVDRSRTVAGKPTSLLDLGYNHVGLDGGWNQCYAENHTFHWASDGRPVWNNAFPKPEHMVTKAHALGLKPGWYLNNCGCAEHDLNASMADTIMRGSVKMAADMKWDGVKFDSCSMFHNLTKWADLINQTNRPMLLENCHQGAYTPGIGQWQGYIKNTTSKAYYHFLGTFFGLGSATLVPKVTFAACKSHCDALQAECGGFTFKSLEAEPSTPVECYVEARPRQNHMDMSNTNYCTGSSDPSDCPYNLYRVSGDISASWGAMLANLAYTLPFLGEGGVHLPFPQDSTIRSRPGGWAYPDMLEVGNLANATEDRSHFGAWAIISSPLILSFNLSDDKRMDRAWPIITNKAVLAVNQKWAGSPGRRITLSPDGWQAWAKPMRSEAYAVFLINTGSLPAATSLPLSNVSHVFTPHHSVCRRDLYTGKMLSLLAPGAPLEETLPAHDSGMYGVWPSTAAGSCDGPGANEFP